MAPDESITITRTDPEMSISRKIPHHSTSQYRSVSGEKRLFTPRQYCSWRCIPVASQKNRNDRIMRGENRLPSHIPLHGIARISPCTRPRACEVTPLRYHGTSEIIIFLGTSIYPDLFADTYSRYIPPLSLAPVFSPYIRYESPTHLDPTVKCDHTPRALTLSGVSGIPWEARREW